MFVALFALEATGKELKGNAVSMLVPPLLPTLSRGNWERIERAASTFAIMNLFLSLEATRKELKVAARILDLYCGMGRQLGKN